MFGAWLREMKNPVQERPVMDGGTSTRHEPGTSKPVRAFVSGWRGVNEKGHFDEQGQWVKDS